ncbi:E3 ubiquitin-protein ligase RNF152 isoform X2 [Larus michahellis]|uniref:E3 ubiquitin-protein ligase RNF152 isoform X2 n=1 Tax=Larus michahellis TaxID=119627 RepID=UPI003D9B0B82
MPPTIPPARARGRRGFRNRLPCPAPPRTAPLRAERGLRRRFLAPAPAFPAAPVPPRPRRGEDEGGRGAGDRAEGGCAVLPGRAAGREGYFESRQGRACIASARASSGGGLSLCFVSKQEERREPPPPLARLHQCFKTLTSWRSASQHYLAFEPAKIFLLGWIFFFFLSTLFAWRY